MKSLDQFKDNNVINIRFTGGEFTCKKDWYDIFKYAKELNFAVSCNTNAVYYNPKLCEQLAKLKLNQVTVSLDGDKKSHEMNRGKGTFDRTLKNIHIMHSLGVRLRIDTLVNRYSFKDVERMLEIATKYTDEINFFTIVFIGRGSQLESTDGISIQDHYEMSEKINRLKKQYPKLNVLHFAEVSKTTSVNTDLREKFSLKIGPPSGSTTFNVLSNGDYCCGGYLPYIDNKLVLGNVRYDNVFDVWQKNNSLEKIRNDGAKLILFCNKCPEFISHRCQGSKYETELHRLLNPSVKNPTCIYGDGPSLLTLS